MNFGFSIYTLTPGFEAKAEHTVVPLESDQVEESNVASQSMPAMPDPERLSEVPITEKVIESAQSYGVANSLYQFKDESSALRAGRALKVLEGVYETGYREKAFLYAFSNWKSMFYELSHNKAHQAEWLIGVSKFLKHNVHGNPHDYERIHAMGIAEDLITNKNVQLPDERLKDLAFLYIENHDVNNTVHWLKKANATKTDFIDAAVNFFGKDLFKAGCFVLAHGSQNDVLNSNEANNVCRIPRYLPPVIKKIAESMMESEKFKDVRLRNELINEPKKSREIDILIKAFCCMGYFDSAVDTAKKEDLSKGSIVYLLNTASFLESCFHELSGAQINFTEEMKKTIFSRFLDNSSPKIKMQEGYINLLLQTANQMADRKKGHGSK